MSTWHNQPQSVPRGRAVTLEPTTKRPSRGLPGAWFSIRPPSVGGVDAVSSGGSCLPVLSAR